MTQGVTHLIITRFNLAVAFGDIKRKDSKVPGDHPWLNTAYLKKRFAIFEKYTFQSLLRQTEQDFVWLLLFHKDTPDQYKKEIAVYCRKMKQITPLFFSDEECARLGEVLSAYIGRHWKETDIITTRVDNDDVVHNTFVERIQKDIKKENSIILSYENGLQYDIRSKEILKYQDRQNHFLSLYTKKGGNHHILLYDHTHIFQMTKTKKLQIQVEKTAPMWVEIITENNFSNAMHWRFSTILVPFQIKEEFALLDINYKTKAGWLWEMITGAFKVFFYRGRGLINMVWGNKENR